MARLTLIAFLVLLAGANMYLDFARPAFSNVMDLNAFLSIAAVGVATALPSLAAYLVSSKTVFTLKNLNIYKISSDLILFASLIAWCYLVFIRERPEFYHGASHMYVATWPIIIGLFAILLYLGCLLVQLSCKVYQKHNKSKQQGPAAGTR